MKPRLSPFMMDMIGIAEGDQDIHIKEKNH
jgi:hypothetical protein